ncbi:hypothetical protein ACHAXR_000849, partial [Thalassiosira sp. AJA248-18]
IAVKSNTGTEIREGDDIVIQADVFCESSTTSFADIYHTTNPHNPVWAFIGTYDCPGNGHQTITAQHKLTGGEPEQASDRNSCSNGSYDDADDLVFQVKRKNFGRAVFGKESSTLGWHNFNKRSDLVKPENLNHGTLTIELRMKLDEAKSRVNFIPENSLGKHMLGLFLDKESADVLFELPNDDHSSKVQYYAHSLILKSSAPALARLCEGSTKLSPVAIPDVEPQVFLQLLQYVYGGDIRPDWENDAKKFIDAAGKYGVINLKVEAEAWYVAYCNFTVENMVADLLYADAKNCPLLREAAIDFIWTHSA